MDDELLVRMGFRSILDWESCGLYRGRRRGERREALEKIRLLQPDLVFTDLKMDRMDGLELMSACMREYPAVKFIVLSSYNDFENVRQAMRCGALDYVFKLEVTPEQLRRILSKLNGRQLSLSRSGRAAGAPCGPAWCAGRSRGHPGGRGTRELRADVSRRALGAAVQADHGGYR